MFTALTFAVLSAVCMALMVVTDRLMVGDCYKGNSDHAWFVSSVAGSLFGLFLTALLWFWGSSFGFTADATTLLAIAKDFFIWKGLAAIVVGALGIQILLHYFRCFGEDAHSSVIAAWLASTPIFVFLGMLCFSYFVSADGAPATSTNALWVSGVFLATFGLIAFERMTGGPGGNVGVYRRELVTLLALNVVYTIALKQVFSIEQSETEAVNEAVALMPFYWIGFAAGGRVLFNKGIRDSFRLNWRKRLRYFIAPILFVEVIGMLVFFFEYLSLISLDPTVVTIILGAHVILVYLFDLIFGWIREGMERRSQRRMYLMGIRLLRNKLPPAKFNIKVIATEMTVILVIVTGITLVIMHTGA